jgi:hypothetical protein
MHVQIIRIMFIVISLVHWVTWFHFLHADEALAKVNIDTAVWEKKLNLWGC